MHLVAVQKVVLLDEHVAEVAAQARKAETLSKSANPALADLVRLRTVLLRTGAVAPKAPPPLHVRSSLVAGRPSPSPSLAAVKAGKPGDRKRPGSNGGSSATTASAGGGGGSRSSTDAISEWRALGGRESEEEEEEGVAHEEEEVPEGEPEVQPPPPPQPPPVPPEEDEDEDVPPFFFCGKLEPLVRRDVSKIVLGGDVTSASTLEVDRKRDLR